MENWRNEVDTDGSLGVMSIEERDVLEQQRAQWIEGLPDIWTAPCDRRFDFYTGDVFILFGKSPRRRLKLGRVPARISGRIIAAISFLRRFGRTDIRMVIGGRTGLKVFEKGRLLTTTTDVRRLMKLACRQGLTEGEKRFSSVSVLENGVYVGSW